MSESEAPSHVVFGVRALTARFVANYIFSYSTPVGRPYICARYLRILQGKQYRLGEVAIQPVIVMRVLVV